MNEPVGEVVPPIPEEVPVNRAPVVLITARMVFDAADAKQAIEELVRRGYTVTTEPLMRVYPNPTPEVDRG